MFDFIENSASTTPSAHPFALSTKPVQHEALEQDLDNLHKTISDALLKNKTESVPKLKIQQPFSPAFTFFREMSQSKQEECAIIINNKIKAISELTSKLSILIKASSEKRRNIILMISDKEKNESESFISLDFEDLNELISNSIQEGQTTQSFLKEIEILENNEAKAKEHIAKLEQMANTWNGIKNKLKQSITNTIYHEKREQIKIKINEFMESYVDFVAVSCIGSGRETKRVFELELGDLLNNQYHDMHQIKELTKQYMESIDNKLNK